MTGGRRKSGRKAGSSSKKESSERSRRSARRRGHKKSESEPEDSGSDASADATPTSVSEEDKRPSGESEAVKGDESGGSDGAWHVRSENGNKGGIPKLKLCLQRPAEVSSPTSESLPSPRPKRSRRGASPLQETSEAVCDDNPTAAVNDAPVAPEDVHPEEENVNNQLNRNEESPLEEEKMEVVPESSEEVAVAVAEVCEDVEQQEPTPIVEEVPATEVAQDERKTRSPSRDSSEERAKEEALKSRGRKKKEGSEEGEVVESPEPAISFPARTGGRIRTAGSESHEDSKEVSVNNDEGSTTVVRKRRWGSSNVRTIKKAPVSISTDMLKEIIPEAKPVALSEVELSPNEDQDMEEGEMKETRRRSSRSDEGKKIVREEKVNTNSVTERKRSNIPSDESEKDYEEEAVDSGGEELIRKEAPSKEIVTEESNEQKDSVFAVRKVAVVAADPLALIKKQRSPSPAQNPPTNILYVTGLVRPFTVPQLRDLLARTGVIVEEGGFWIDKIKSRCYVKYTTEEEAVNTRHALHGIRWPASNPKTLSVDFGTEEKLKIALEGGRAVNSDRGDSRLPIKRLSIEDHRERDHERIKDGEREKVREEKNRSRERDRERNSRVDDRERKVKIDESREREHSRERDRDRAERTVRKVTTIPVREWDLGKAERGFSPPPIDNRFDNERDKATDDDRRKREKERSRRSSSGEPVRKIKKKIEDGPAKVLLEDLFRKTKASPAIYWLPLTTEQIAVREEMRRKHMAEHEKRIAEQRKRQEARRRKPRSKSRSRSRSPKK